MSKTVPEMLRECADVFEQRHAVYGDNYKRFGRIMQAMFPDGILIKSVDDWNRIGLFVQVLSKFTRYANQFSNGGHDDSALDTSVYMQMLREIDAGCSQETLEETVKKFREEAAAKRKGAKR